MNVDGRPLSIRGAIFDLDEVLLNKRPAWAYTIEQALLSVSGNRVDSAPLATEYRHRPWRDALSVLEEDGERAWEAAELCEKMWERSALKHITVHEGIGMALAALLAGGITMAAVTSVPLSLARRQAQSAGVDRFLVALEPHPGSEGGYDSVAALLPVGTAAVAFVSGDEVALTMASSEGLRPFQALWAPGTASPFPQLGQATDLRILRAGLRSASSPIE